jgi:hypothetical protein
MKNINHNVWGGFRNARNEKNDKKANAFYLFIHHLLARTFSSVFQYQIKIKGEVFTRNETEWNCVAC